MKNFTAIIISFILAIFSFGLKLQYSSLNVNATSNIRSSYTYAMANSRASYFFSGRDLSSSLFCVPYTYCVQLLRDDGEWYYVKYAEDNGVYRSLYGYCRAADFTLLDAKPETTFLSKIIVVTYKADDTSLNLPVLNELSVEAAFYGTYYSGATAYSYVLCQGSFGYITGANDDYELNTTIINSSQNNGSNGSSDGSSQDTSNSSSETPTDSSNNASSSGLSTPILTALVITALAVLVLLTLYFTTRKPHNQ
jgi:hypothetical protein